MLMQIANPPHAAQNGPDADGEAPVENLTTTWQRLDKRRAAILALATVAAFLAVLSLARLATAPRMELLFAQLEPAAAAEVVASLEASGTEFEVRGGAIYVDGALRDGLRMRLAGEGLPRTDGTGYELLDGLSGFGTTSQMFDAAYWRAREGELTRTILAAPGLRTARVLLATADASPFARDRKATASVTLQMASGAVSEQLARAVQSLVAGAVPNLLPADVTVVDAASGRVVGGAAVDTEAEARSDRMAEMRAAVENLLAARVGEGRYVVELALETTQDRETITERVLDPESRVVVSTETEERSAAETGAAGQGVTVASNLPDGDAAAGPEGSESSSAETRERVNYDFSATQRQIERGPGAIERVTVAVMVDGVRRTGADGTAAWAPREEAELETIRELVQSAVGYREARGDVVTVRTMEFEALPAAEPAPGLSLPWLTGGQVAQIVTALLLALVALAALMFGVKPMLNTIMTPALAPPAPDAASPASRLLGEPADAPRELGSRAGRLEDGAEGLPGLPGPVDDARGAPAGEDPVDRLRRLIADRREETIEVLRGWMDEPQGTAR